MPRTKVLLLTLLAATVALVGARVTQAADPLKECRLSCKQAKGACIGEVKHHLQALLGECVGGSSERRQCRRQARGTARAERTACGDFVRECHFQRGFPECVAKRVAKDSSPYSYQVIDRPVAATLTLSCGRVSE